VTDITRSTADLGGFEVPVIEAAGDPLGPRLTVISGAGGGEYAAIAAVRRWAASLAGRPLAGRVTVLPVVNVPAFRARGPAVVPSVVPADGKDPGGCFPGPAAGTAADRIAAALFECFIAGGDALVDVRAGDPAEALEPFAIYDAGPAEGTARAMAGAYGVGYVVRMRPRREPAVSGTTRAAAAGIPAIIAGAGGRGLIEEDAVATHLRGLDGVLGLLGMRPGWDPAAQEDPLHLETFLWPRAATAGWWQSAVRVGEAVQADQVLGVVESIDGGTVLETVTAPSDGVVLFLTSSPAVAASGLLLGIGAG
jgi:uncharacterized protein